MNEITKSNLNTRLDQIVMRLGALAYERREHVLRMEVIDLEVGQMESQRVLIEATRNDIIIDERDEAGRLEAEKANAKKERSERSKAAAQKRKRATTKAAPREGKATKKA